MHARSIGFLGLTAALLASCGTAAAPPSSASTSSSSSLVTIAVDADLNTMDCETATDGTSFVMQGLCESGLTERDENGEAQPDLAESWDISDDGKTYTFHLRDGIKWSNGDPVTAADFVYGWQRLVDPDTASEYNFIASAIHVENADEVIAGTLPVSELGVEAADDQTFVVHLSLPCSFMLSLMSFPSFFPLNQKFYESEGDNYAQSVDDLLYCGPYTMTDWETGNQYTFTKNPDYWGKDTIYTDQIRIRFLQDTQSALLEYQSGNIDFVTLTSEQVDAMKNEAGFTTRMQGSSWRLAFNFTDERFQNKDLREAISKAIDRTSITDNVLKDGSVAAQGFIPQQFASGPDGTYFRDTAGDLISEDVTEAQAAYARAKEALGGDVSITLLYDDSEECKAVAENLQSQLQTNLPGLTVSLDSRPKKTRLQLMNSNDYEIGLTRWGPDYDDPQTFLDLYKSNSPGYTGSYSNSEYDALLDQAETGEDAADSQARWNDLIAAEKVLLDDYACVPIYQNGGALMINPKVSGYILTVSTTSYRHVKKEA